MYADYLLTGETARQLYESTARSLPVIDYHNHLDVDRLADNTPFSNITEFWLAGDHYKWRAMRTAGVEERCITGDAPPREKFAAWISTMELLAGSPLYAWCRMELETLFETDLAPVAANADAIYDYCTAKLALPAFLPMEMLRRFGVEVSCSTNDPFESLEYHQRLAAQNATPQVLPTFRPDKLLAISAPAWLEHLTALATSEGMDIASLDQLKAALLHSLERFTALGCRSADHGFSRLPAVNVSERQAEAVLAKALEGGMLDHGEVDAFAGHLLAWLAAVYNQKSMVMQLHLGPIRNQNTALFQALGADVGGDCIGPGLDIVALSRLLDGLHQTGNLPKTILFSINRHDWAELSALCPAFQSAGTPCRVQPGAAWWFSDTERGIRELMDELAEHALLGGFLGMLTDSRSIGSFVRHDYFRRILCSWLGELVDRGDFPDQIAAGRLVASISYYNAAAYFDLKER